MRPRHGGDYDEGTSIR